MTSRLFTLLACVALVGGVVWAAQSQTLALPGGPVSVDAVLVPGDDGGVRFIGGKWTDEVDLDIGFGGGVLAINSSVIGPVVAGNSHSVHVEIVDTGNGYDAIVTVVDDVTSLALCEDHTVSLGANASTSVTAEGDEVTSLTAE